MVILITGASHTGKTVLAQRILEEYHISYLSADHLKMGLIRSGNTHLTPLSENEAMTQYLWPILREIIKTAIENHQDLTVEGCYIPFNWREDFSEEYLSQIRYCCLVMSPKYIREHFADIKKYANVVEQRIDDDACTMENMLQDNAWYLEQVQSCGAKCVMIDDYYAVVSHALEEICSTEDYRK